MASKSSSSSLDPSWDPNSLKLAIAIALLRYKKLHQQSSSSSTSEVDLQRWKRKAKERKQEVLRLREELKLLEDGAGEGSRQVFPEVVSCKCHFLDGCGKLSPRRLCLEGDGSGDGGCGQGHWIDEALRRRFLRHVRGTERRKKANGSVHRRHFSEVDGEDEMERLCTSVDFLVELTDTVSHEKNNPSFSALSHQAVDFILASLKNLLSWNKGSELIEEIVHGLVSRLSNRMCTTSEKDGPIDSDLDDEFFVQHLIRKLGSEPYIGQRALLSISQRLSILADSLIFMDPFDDAFPDTHNCMFMMLQLLEFLISDYIQIWMSNADFDQRLFEEWVRSVLQARRSLELLECRNGLYVLFTERVVGELAKQVGPLLRKGKIDLDILSEIFS